MILSWSVYMKKFLDNYLDKCIGIILIIAVAILINKIVDK